MFQPSDSRPAVERPRRRDERATERWVTCHAFPAAQGIQSVEQKRLVIVDLHIRTKTVIRQRYARRHIENSSLLRVHFDKWLCACHHHGPSAWIYQRDTLISTRWPVIPHKHAGIAGRVAIQNGATEIHGLARCSNRDRREYVIFAWSNHHPARLCRTAWIRGDKTRRDGAFLNPS